MRFEVSESLLSQAKDYNLMSSCDECRYRIAGKCLFDWPDRGQSKNLKALSWPEDKDVAIDFCREFEAA